ncbi:MAG: hypothetical protein ACHP8A_01685 [Terriglobales bacterium]
MPAPDGQHHPLRLPRHAADAVLLFPSPGASPAKEKDCGANPPRWFESAPLKDAASVQRALMQVMTRLLSDNIGHKQAAKILYKLQTASLNFPTRTPGPGPEK